MMASNKPMRARRRYQRRFPVWRVDRLIFRPDPWNGSEKADEPAVRPVVRAYHLQTVMKNDLVDAFWLMNYPITLGSGKRLFDGGAIPARFKVTESLVAPNGVIVVNYERSGAITTK